MGLVEPDSFGDILGNRLDTRADPATIDLTGSLQMVDDRASERRGDGEADPDRPSRG